MDRRVKQFLIFAGVLVLAFLAGFLPEYFRANGFQQQMNDAGQRLEFCRVRDLWGMTFLQTSMKNYGLASRYSTQFFDAAKELAGRTAAAEVREKLQAAVANRDTITAQLARADPAAYASVQAVYKTLLEPTAGTTQ